jgi:hypothetical protein
MHATTITIINLYMSVNNKINMLRNQNIGGSSDGIIGKGDIWEVCGTIKIGNQLYISY